MIEDVENVIIGCVFDVFAGGGAQFEDLLGSQDEVAAELGVLHQHHLLTGDHCVYYRHLIILHPNLSYFRVEIQKY